MQSRLVSRVAFRFSLAIGLTLGLAASALAQSDGMGRLDRLLPADCLFYSGWNPAVTLDPAGGNHAEALMAEPEVQAFFQDLSGRMEKLIPGLIPDSGDERARIARRLVPDLAKALMTRPGCIFLEGFGMPAEGMPPTIDGAFILDVGGDAAELADSLAKLTREPGAPDVGVETSGGVKLHRIEIPEPGAPAIHLGAADGLLFLTVGDKFVENLNRGQSGQAAPEWLAKLHSRNVLRKPTSYGWIDLAALRDHLLEAAPPEAGMVVRELGLDSLTQVESVGGFDDEGIASRVRVGFTGQPRGILALNGENGISEAELQHVPADALFAAGFSIDAGRVLELVEKFLEQFSPDEMADFEEGFEAMQRELGIDVRGDIIAALGSTWTLYNGASDGLGTGLTLTVTVKDKDAFSKAIDQLSQVAQAALARDDEAPKVVRTKMEGTDVYSLQFQGMPVPVEPSWCLAGDQLVVTLFPQSMAPFLKNLPHEPLVDDAMFTRLATPFAGGKSGNVIGFSYTDTRRQFELLYPWGQMMLTMMQGMGEEMDMPPEFSETVGPALRGISLPPARVIYPHLRPALTAMRRTPEGFEFETRQTLPMIDVTMAAPVLAGLLLPAVQQIREAARRTQSMNNLKQLALSAHNFESAFKRLPPGGTVNAEGQQLLSWRVYMLPYLEQQGLYDQFHFDEPWDSEHNLKLLDQMPEVFRSPASNAPPNMTVYRGIGGSDGVFRLASPGDDWKGTRFGDFQDGMSNTILIVETSDSLAVPWTQPDPGFDPDVDDLYGLMGNTQGGFLAAMADGSVRLISFNVDWETIRNAMKMADGNIVNLDW